MQPRKCLNHAALKGTSYAAVLVSIYGLSLKPLQCFDVGKKQPTVIQTYSLISLSMRLQVNGHWIMGHNVFYFCVMNNILRVALLLSIFALVCKKINK